MLAINEINQVDFSIRKALTHAKGTAFACLQEEKSKLFYSETVAELMTYLLRKSRTNLWVSHLRFLS